MSRALVVVIAAVLAGSSPAASQTVRTPDVQPARVALVTTFADGRTLTNLVAEKSSWYWTPMFPRLWPQVSQGQFAVGAIKFTFNRIALDVNVIVSVLRGPGLRDEEEIARVSVPPGEHVVVNQVEALGIRAIDLSQTVLPPTTVYIPQVATVSPQLVVGRVDLVTAPYPGYRIELVNFSSSPLASFHVDCFRADSAKSASSSISGGPQGQPLIPASGSYVLEINLKSGSSADREIQEPRAFDRIVVDGILWDDGTIAGIEPWGDGLRRVPAEAGQRLQLTRVLDVFKEALKDQADDPYGMLLLRIREDIEALADAEADRLSLAQLNMRQIKAGVLRELQLFEERGFHDPAGDRRWVEEKVRAYELWIKRLPDL